MYAIRSYYDQLRREGNHRPGRERRHQDHDRREEIQPLARVRREDDFLEEQLHPVGDRLQQPRRADAVRPQADLHPSDELALPQRQVGSYNFV